MSAQRLSKRTLAGSGFVGVPCRRHREDGAEVLPEKISLDLTIEDPEVRQWWLENASKMQAVLEKRVVDLYQTEKILRS
mgnify:CR=1 FL=1